MDSNNKKISLLSVTSPKAYNDLKARVLELTVAINKHTENIVEISSYLRKLSYLPLESIQKEFNFTDDDMVDLPMPAQ